MIHYNTRETPLWIGFIDFDWVGDPYDRKSTTGYVFTLGWGLITWSCKKQSAMAFSSVEEEYHATVQASEEAMSLPYCLVANVKKDIWVMDSS